MRLREIGLNTEESGVYAKSTVLDNTQARFMITPTHFYHLIMHIINAAISALIPIFLHFAEDASVFETYFCNMVR